MHHLLILFLAALLAAVSRGGKLGRPSVAELGQPASLEPAVFGG
jgi:hypothetical protein